MRVILTACPLYSSIRLPDFHQTLSYLKAPNNTRQIQNLSEQTNHNKNSSSTRYKLESSELRRTWPCLYLSQFHDRAYRRIEAKNIHGYPSESPPLFLFNYIFCRPIPKNTA